MLLKLVQSITLLNEIVHQSLILLLVIYFWTYMLVFWIHFLNKYRDYFFPRRIQLPKSNNYCVPSYIQIYLPEKQLARGPSDYYILSDALAAEKDGFIQKQKDHQDVLKSILRPDDKKPKWVAAARVMNTPIYHTNPPQCRFYASPLLYGNTSRLNGMGSKGTTDVRPSTPFGINSQEQQQQLYLGGHVPLQTVNNSPRFGSPGTNKSVNLLGLSSQSKQMNNNASHLYRSGYQNSGPRTVRNSDTLMDLSMDSGKSRGLEGVSRCSFYDSKVYKNSSVNLKYY